MNSLTDRPATCNKTTMKLKSRCKKSPVVIEPDLMQTMRAEATQLDLPVISFQATDSHYIDPFACIDHFSFVSNVHSFRAPSANKNNTPTLGNFFEQIQCFRSNNREPLGLQSAFTPDLSRGAFAALQEDSTREIRDFEEGFIFFDKTRSLRKSPMLKHRLDCSCCRRLEQRAGKADRTDTPATCDCKASTCKGTVASVVCSKKNKRPTAAKSLTCTCKKSGCQNNYCPCHQAGISCSRTCDCSTCHNDKNKASHSGLHSDVLRCNSAIRKHPGLDASEPTRKASLLAKRKPREKSKPLFISQLSFAPG